MAIRIDKVYTRFGDAGRTRLVGGKVVAKSDLQVETYGTVDELNCCLAVAVALLEPEHAELYDILLDLERRLFDLGAELATPLEFAVDPELLFRSEATTKLEELCDTYNNDLPSLSTFILPGGSPLAAELHRARAVCRRAERLVVRLERELEVEGDMREFNPEIVTFLNRLSDLLFVLARWVLVKSGVPEVLWKP